MKIRVGFGFDVHQLVAGRELWLGGIRLEHEKGLLGHSDADVLIHTICDALLGAANMRDIGYHFPDTAGEFKNIDSKILLKKTIELIATKGYSVGNIDATICAERPKLKANSLRSCHQQESAPQNHSSWIEKIAVASPTQYTPFGISIHAQSGSGTRTIVHCTRSECKLQDSRLYLHIFTKINGNFKSKQRGVCPGKGRISCCSG